MSYFVTNRCVFFLLKSGMYIILQLNWLRNALTRLSLKKQVKRDLIIDY